MHDRTQGSKAGGSRGIIGWGRASGAAADDGCRRYGSRLSSQADDGCRRDGSRLSSRADASLAAVTLGVGASEVGAARRAHGSERKAYREAYSKQPPAR
jgi:hypothetical protein